MQINKGKKRITFSFRIDEALANEMEFLKQDGINWSVKLRKFINQVVDENKKDRQQ